MGYETEVPQIPDRLTEELMIKDIKRSFKAQPYHVFEIPDSMRVRKLEWRDTLNEYRFTWLCNFVRGGFMSGIVLIPMGLIFKKTGLGIPTFNVPRMYTRSATNEHYIFRARNYKAAKFVIPAWFLASYVYATARTSMESVFDEDLSKVSSAILPHDN